MGYLIAGAVIFAIGTFFGAMLVVALMESVKKKEANNSMPQWPSN